MTIRWQLLALAACAAPVARAPVARPAAVVIGPPAVLLDGAGARFATRVRVGQLGELRLERRGRVLIAEADDEAIAPDAPLVVDDRDRGWVRVRVDADDARLLVWIEEADLAPVFVKARALVDRTTGARVAVGRPGAPARLGDAHGDDRAVTVVDGSVRVAGDVPASALGVFYDARPPRAGTSETLLAAGDDVRASPDGASIAQIIRPVGVHALGPAQNGWIEIEIDRPFLYVRGFVRDDATSPAPPEVPLPHDGGVDATDEPTLLLPAGACLYARPGGPIVGINEAERLRYVRDGGAPGWRQIAVTSAWGRIWAFAHFPEVNGVPAGDYDQCLTRRASRSR